MRKLFCICLLVLSLDADAHHSRIQYDTSTIVEMSGEIVAVRWRNPHVMYTMRVPDSNGGSTDWMLEAGSIYMLGRTGINKNVMQPGETVDIAGYASGDGNPEFYLTNVRLADGQEIVMVPSAKAYWSEEAIGGREQWSVASNASADSAEQGLFRVWSLGEIFTNLTGEATGLPLTAEARAKRDAFDPLTDDPGLDCIKPGMPRTMTGPHPFQFIDGGDKITVLIAEFDIQRTIHLGKKKDAASIVPHKQGYSHGLWKNGVLEVHTSHVDWPFFDGIGTPLSANAKMVEQFSFSENGLQLDYEIVITDPSTFTMPVTLNETWVDLGEPMEFYDCVPGVMSNTN
ncbi:MAG: DUF6152 family protein [Woeseiaceae bacterium]